MIIDRRMGKAVGEEGFLKTGSPLGASEIKTKLGL